MDLMLHKLCYSGWLSFRLV